MMVLSSSGLLRRALTCMLVALVMILAPAYSCAAGWDIDELMFGLAHIRSGHVSFVEKKSIAMLEKPVESSGELFYSAPDHLEKRTFKPKAESMIVNGGELLLERGRQTYHLQLQNYPELAAFIDCILGTLAGDRKALERSYRLSLEGTAERWTLQLLPLDAKMQAVIQHIHIGGERAQVRSIEIVQADGDSALMTIQELATP